MGEGQNTPVISVMLKYPTCNAKFTPDKFCFERGILVLVALDYFIALS